MLSLWVILLDINWLILVSNVRPTAAFLQLYFIGPFYSTLFERKSFDFLLIIQWIPCTCSLFWLILILIWSFHVSLGSKCMAKYLTTLQFQNHLDKILCLASTILFRWFWNFSYIFLTCSMIIIVISSPKVWEIESLKVGKSCL